MSRVTDWLSKRDKSKSIDAGTWINSILVNVETSLKVTEWFEGNLSYEYEDGFAIGKGCRRSEPLQNPPERRGSLGARHAPNSTSVTICLHPITIADPSGADKRNRN